MNIETILKSVIENPYSAFFYTPPIYKDSKSYIFIDPIENLSFSGNKNVDDFFAKIDGLVKKYPLGYVMFNYEFGYLLEKRLSNLLPQSKEKLAQLFFFKKIKVTESNRIKFSDTIKWSHKISDFRLNTTQDKYKKNIRTIKEYIKKGDTYQVNYTVKGKFKLSGSLISLFSLLIFNQSAEFCAFINNGENIVISISPELFFKVDKNKIYSRPMKGTIERGKNNSEDSILINKLKNSGKERAENSMIVDLIRNDLGRVAKLGNVNVKNLFSTEKYETLLQMTSTVEGNLKNKTFLTDIIKSVFPCGSITGAPKIRTMEIINEIEHQPRGIYTGTIGMFRNKGSVFNVPIRTIVINKKNRNGTIGIGSGVVWDSDPSKEFQEVLLKSKFLTEPVNYFELFETIMIKNKKAFLLEEHLKRLKSSSDHFLFLYDEKNIKNTLYEKFKLLNPNILYRCRLALNKWGKVNIKIYPYPEKAKEVKVIISKKRVNSENRFQYHKTTNRALYNNEYLNYSKKGFFDVIFLNEKEEVTEGAISNIFITKGKKTFTPSINSGILDGIYRRQLIKRDTTIIEKKLYLKDLMKADGIFLTNSLRGKTRVKKIYFNNKDFNEFT